MKFIPLHGLDVANNKPFRFFVNAEKVTSVYPAGEDFAKHGYRTTVTLNDGGENATLAVTEKIETVVKRLNGEKEND